LADGPSNRSVEPVERSHCPTSTQSHPNAVAEAGPVDPGVQLSQPSVVEPVALPDGPACGDRKTQRSDANPVVEPVETTQRSHPDSSRTRLTVLAGPTAVGKGTVVTALRQAHPEVWLSVSATTRPPRPGEIDGTHYFFVSDDQFQELVDSGQMLEWATVHNRFRYGTPRRPVEEALAAGRPTLLEIDLQGARQVRAAMPEALFVFLAPPSPDDLVTRIVGRGTEGTDEQIRRLNTAKTELAAEGEFDVVIVNDVVERAASELAAIMGLAG